MISPKKSTTSMFSIAGKSLGVKNSRALHVCSRLSSVKHPKEVGRA